MVEYAEVNGVPYPSISVAGTGVMLILSSVSIVFGAYPKVAAAALMVFFFSVTLMMHPFWREDDPEEYEHEMVNFLKNTSLFGVSLMFFVLGDQVWSYGLNLRFF